MARPSVINVMNTRNQRKIREKSSLKKKREKTAIEMRKKKKA